MNIDNFIHELHGLKHMRERLIEDSFLIKKEAENIIPNASRIFADSTDLGYHLINELIETRRLLWQTAESLFSLQEKQRCSAF